MVIEFPEPGERAERDVELPVGPFAGLPRHARTPSRVSGLTGTAVSPAARLSRSMSLPSFQTLINASSQSNSSKTASMPRSRHARPRSRR